MYVFQVALSSKRAVSFQNLTIDESEEGTIAFVNTYTPTKKWVAGWKSGRAGKFEGGVGVTYLKLNNGTGANSKANKTGTTNVPQICNTTTYYYEIAYMCSAGQHYPEDEGCILTGFDRAGYIYLTVEETICTDDPSQNPGSGGTTPNPPEDYDPCPDEPVENTAKSLKQSRGNKVMVVAPTECDSVEVDCAGVRGGTAYMTDCGCIGGTTGITECPGNEVKYMLDSFPCAKSLVIEMSGLNSDISNLIKSVFGVNDRINLTIEANQSLTGTGTDGQLGASNRFTYNDNLYFSISIGINPDILRNATKEYILVTIYHEALHAYFSLKKAELSDTEFNNQFTGMYVNGGRLLGVQDPQHWSMGYTNFVNGLKDIIMTYNPNFDANRAYAMALGGINTLTPAQLTINQQEKNTSVQGYTGTKCP